MAAAKHPKKTHPKPTHKPTHKPTKPPKTPADPPASGQPVFAQPTPSPDPTGFVDTTSDEGDYSQVDASLMQAIPVAAGGLTEPVLTFAQILGSEGTAATATIQSAGQIVFHSVGDTGNTNGPTSIDLVADKMVADFDEADPADMPAFFFHLGDVIYNFGEGEYYYDQFYDPYRNYPGPILAIAGNHDGEVYKTDPAPTLVAFLRNFCATTSAVSTDAGGLVRTAQIQPGVYFTFDSPFVRILAIYSNVLEDPGVISSQGTTTSPVSDVQLAYLTAALARCKSEKYAGAVIVAVHHPPFTYGSTHSGSPLMSADIDTCATNAGFWPHAVFSGHSHNYQRFTRAMNDTQIPYIVAGCGGHGITKLQSGSNGPIRTPVTVTSTLTFENYNGTDYGYLRVVVTAETLRVEFHTTTDDAKSPDDVVSVDIASRTIVAS